MTKATTAEDEPIRHKMISGSLESAQKRIEGFNFDARKRTLSYDDVLNKQRESIYKTRRDYLVGDKEAIDTFLSEVVELDDTVEQVIAEKKDTYGEEEFYAGIRRLLLQTVDFFWLEHLETMDYLRSSVNLRAYGQRDPLIEYQKEGLRMFRSLEVGVVERVAESIPQMGIGAFQSEEERMKKAAQRAQSAAGSGGTSGGTAPAPMKKDDKIGRNTLVTITNGSETKEMKYKKAELLIESGEWSIVE